MSAAKQLKALDEAICAGPWGNSNPNPKFRHALYELDSDGGWLRTVADFDGDLDARPVAALRNALPQIVAVVFALERVMKPWDNVKNPAVDEALAFARDALAALDEALA